MRGRFAGVGEVGNVTGAIVNLKCGAFYLDYLVPVHIFNLRRFPAHLALPKTCYCTRPAGTEYHIVLRPLRYKSSACTLRHLHQNRRV